jgi:NAD-dependent SIR2 family protein deacetylase
MQEEKDDDIAQCVQWILDADCILIGGGAGLSTETGIDYSDEESFKRDYHALHKKKGITNKWQLIGFKDWTPTEKWGYVIQHIHEVFSTPLHPIYSRLLDIVKSKDYFVLTTNVDSLFKRHGFDPERIYTPQGTFSSFQCLKPCHQEVWPSQSTVEKLYPLIDPTTQELPDPNLIPTCPKCNGPIFANVRGGDWFVHQPYEKYKDNYQKWVKQNSQKKMLLIELGCGFNTPVWIRWPFEAMVDKHPNTKLIRINLEFPQIPTEIAEKSMGIQKKAFDAVTEIWKRVNSSQLNQ